MTWILQMCNSAVCNPCPPPPEPPPSGEVAGLPPFTSAYVSIAEIQISTDLNGNTHRTTLGSMIIWNTGAGTNQGQFGSPLSFGPPDTSSIVQSVVVFESSVIIVHPYYPDGSYDSSLPTVTTGPLTATASATDGSTLSNQNATIIAGNAAIAQANQVLGNTPKP